MMTTLSVFPCRLVTTTIDDAIAVLQICRQRAHQSLSPASLFQLHQAIQRAEADPAVRGMIITGEGSAFCTGADVRYFLNALQEPGLSRIIAFTKAGNDCFDMIERCRKPVVAAINGSALGGGLELALACHRRVVGVGATLAFPETGLGLIPGWGGMTRAANLIGMGLAKWLIYSGKSLSLKNAHSIGLVDRVVRAEDVLDAASALVRDAADRLAMSGHVEMDRTQSHNGFADSSLIAQYFELNTLAAVTAGRVIEDPPRTLVRLKDLLAGKGPIALQLAERYFQNAASMTRERRAAFSLDLVVQLFQTRDAHLGLTRCIEGAIGRVPFQGN